MSDESTKRRRYYEAHREEKLAYGRVYRQTHRERLRTYFRDYHQRHRARLLANNYPRKLKRDYGITPEQYALMLEGQGGGCFFCPTKKGRRLVVDHDHTTGTVRGVLWISHNAALAALGDGLDGIDRVLVYLLRKPPLEGVKP